jgi:hypothetical protein
LLRDRECAGEGAGKSQPRPMPRVHEAPGEIDLGRDAVLGGVGKLPVPGMNGAAKSSERAKGAPPPEHRC